MELVGMKNINDKKVSLDEINCKLYSEGKISDSINTA